MCVWIVYVGVSSVLLLKCLSWKLYFKKVLIVYWSLSFYLPRWRSTNGLACLSWRTVFRELGVQHRIKSSSYPRSPALLLHRGNVKCWGFKFHFSHGFSGSQNQSPERISRWWAAVSFPGSCVLPLSGNFAQHPCQRPAPPCWEHDCLLVINTHKYLLPQINTKAGCTINLKYISAAALNALWDCHKCDWNINKSIYPHRRLWRCPPSLLPGSVGLSFHSRKTPFVLLLLSSIPYLLL